MIDRETKYKLRIEKRGLNIPIDKTAENYRCCLYCDYEFMADDLKQFYCCQKCHDDYNNAKKKFKIKEMTPIFFQGRITEKLTSDKKLSFKQLKLNNAILAKISNDGKLKVVYNIEDLQKDGFDFTVFQGSIMIEKESSIFPIFYVFVMSYKIAQINQDQVLFEKINKNERPIIN
jgi:hypothetical protein